MSKKTQTQRLFDCLILNTAEQVLVLPIHELLYAKASTSYTIFVEISGKSWRMSKPLSFFQAKLVAHGFFRIHRSYMINLQHLRRFDKTKGMTYLINDTQVPFSKDHVKKLVLLSEE